MEDNTYTLLDKSVPILIVEDEPIIAEDIKYMLEEMGLLETDIVHSAEEALIKINSKEYHLALLDINLDGKLDGIDLAKKLEATNKMPYLFLTSLSDSYTVKRVASITPSAYLIKPIDEAELRVNIDLALSRRIYESKVYPKIYYLKGKTKMTKVDTSELLYLEGSNNYTILHTNDKKHVVSQTLKKVMMSLDPSKFIRIHKSAIINLSQIDEIEDAHVKIGKHRIPIGRTYRDVLFSQLNTI